MSRLITAPLIALLLAAATQADSSWVKREVLPNASSVKWRAEKNGAPIEDGRRRVPWVVRTEEGEWLFFSKRGVSGWALKSEVVGLDDAPAHFGKLIEQEPTAWAYSMRGVTWLAMDEYDAAIEDFSRAIDLDPSDVRAYVGRGDAWFNRGEFDNAIADYTASIRLNPKNLVAYVGRGGAWEQKGEYEKAISDTSEAIRLAPNQPVAYNNRAWFWATCPDDNVRDGGRVVESATKACELTKWQNPDCLDTLAAACAENGDFKNAVKWVQKALDLAPEKAKEVHRSRLALYQSGKPYRQQRD